MDNTPESSPHRCCSVCSLPNLPLVHALGHNDGPLHCHDCGYSAGVADLVKTGDGRAKLAGVLLEACASDIRHTVRAALSHGDRLEDLGAIIIERGLAQEYGIPSVIVDRREVIAEILGRHAHHAVLVGMPNHIPVVVRLANSVGSHALEINEAA